MKRLLPFIPIILLFLVNSCGPYPTGASAIDTAVAARIAASWTPTPTPTISPTITEMIKVLNSDLASASPLGWIIDAQYYVVDITFPDNPNKSGRIARVDVNCICMKTTDCCIPERTFVVIVESMRRSIAKISLQEFGGVGEFTVECSDLKTTRHIGITSAPWQDVYNYLLDPTMFHHLTGHIDVQSP